MMIPPNRHAMTSTTFDNFAAAQERLLTRFPVVRWTVDTRRCIHSVAGGVLTDLGHHEAVFMGMPLTEFYAGSEDASAAIAAHERALCGTPAEFRVTWRGRDYHGHLEPVRDENGELIGCIGAALDVTHANREAERLERANRFTVAITTLVEEALRTSVDESFYRKIVEVAVSTVHGAHAGSIWLLGPDGLYRSAASVGFDQQALAQIGFSPDQVFRGAGTREQLTRNMEALKQLDPDKHAQLMAAGPMHAIQASLSLPIAVNGEILAHLHLHNMEADTPFADDETQMARMLAGNIALLLQRTQLETRLRAGTQRLERLLEEYKQLAAFSAEIETIHDTDELIELGMKRLLDTLQFDTAMFSEVGEGAMEFTRLRGQRPPELVETLRAPMPLGAGVNGRVAQTGEPLYVHDYRAWPDKYEAYLPTGVESMLALPIKRQGEVRHTISFATLNRRAAIDENAEQVARGFVARLENAFERVNYLEEIAATRDATFRALGLALEYRDLETRGHTDRVVDLARRFATALDLDPARRQAFIWGAYLHDIGKIAVPDTILLKPGRLTDEEFGIIRQHTIYGVEMTRGIPFLPTETRQVIRSHHEHWDGYGYPDRLAGNEIPLLARMFALVDVYDALTSVRPYKPAWTHEEAAAELQAQAGKQFAPDLVETFLAVLAKRSGRG